MNASRHSRSVAKYRLPGIGVRSSSETDVGSGTDNSPRPGTFDEVRTAMSGWAGRSDPSSVSVGGKATFEASSIVGHAVVSWSGHSVGTGGPPNLDRFEVI